MDVVIIGPSDRSLLWRHGSLSEEEYDSFVDSYAKLLSTYFEHGIVTPDDGVYTDVALALAAKKNNKAIAYYPDTHDQYGIDHIKKNFSQYDVRPIKGNWYTLDAELSKKSLIILCVGISPGSLIELGFVKYHQKYGSFQDPAFKHIHVLIDLRCIDRKLPASFEEQTSNVHYFDSFGKLDMIFQEIVPKLSEFSLKD